MQKIIMYAVADGALAKKLHLSGAELLSDARLVQKDCNGFGAENQPAKVRKILTWIYRNYAVAGMIHDLRYSFGVGSRAAADDEFHENMLILWRSRYGKWRRFNPVAWYAKFKIDAAFAAVREFGESAWTAGYVK